MMTATWILMAWSSAVEKVCGGRAKIEKDLSARQVVHHKSGWFLTGPLLPVAEDVYSWTRLCPLSAIRVVVIGQDPYHVCPWSCCALRVMLTGPSNRMTDRRT